jgi:hypothetical protein
MKRSPLLVCLALLLLLVPVGVSANPIPVINQVTPPSGTNTGTDTVSIIIHGSGFVPGITVWMKHCFLAGQIDGHVDSVTPTEITATFPMYGQAPGAWKIWVRNPGDSENPQGNVALKNPGYTIIDASSTGTTTTTTTTTTITATETTTVTTTTTPQRGKNSVFFETNPSGATIYMDGEEVGTSSFSYYTDEDGSFSIVAKKSGYEDYEGKVTIVEGQRARFYGLLTPLSSTNTAATTAVTGVTGTGTPAKTTAATRNATTTIRKSTLKIPTPLGTDPPLTAEESPADPATVLWAAGIAIMLVVIRRR